MRAVPTYRIHTWRQTSPNEEELRYRPTLRTVLNRLPVTAICFLGAGLWAWGFNDLEHRLGGPVSSAQRFTGVPLLYPPGLGPLRRESLVAPNEPTTASPTPAVQEGLQAPQQEHATPPSEALVAEFIEHANLDAALARAKHRAEIERRSHARFFAQYAHYGITAFFALLGVYAPLSCLWNRVTVSRTRHGEVKIESFFLRPRTAYWPVDAFHAIRTFAVEHYGFSRYGKITYHRWEWLVQLSLKGQPHMPFLGSAGLASGEMSPQFHIYQEKRQPSMIGKAPEPVRELVKGLRAITGLKAEAPELIEGRRVGRRNVAYRHQFTEEEGMPVSRQEFVFKHGEPLPDHIRARISGMHTGLQHRPGGVIRNTTQTIVVRDEAGNEITYGSVDELPEEVRRRLGL